MKTKFFLLLGFVALFSRASIAQQAPVANFSIGPQPICSNHPIQITDLSTGGATAWSYTISAFGPGQPTVVTVQNPTINFNFQGTYTITQVVSNSGGTSAPFTQTVQVLGSPNANINPANQNSCIGGNPVNIVVTAGGAGGGAITYSWSTGATSNSITVNPSVTTVYTCVLTSTNGCSSDRTSTVTISSPTVNITASPANICPGSSSTLVANINGPGPHTFIWSTGSTTNNITTSVSGVYNVTVTNASNCSGTQSYSLGVSNTLSLTVTSTPSTLCSGSTATLHVTGGSNYLWSFNSAGANPTVNPVNTSTYSVVGTAGTCSGTAVYTLQVSQIPTITVVSSSNSICSGATVSLSANGASTYTWLPGNANTSSIVVSPSVTTTYTARGINPGCTARNGTVLITVNPSPNINIAVSSTLICSGDAVALVANGASTYTWNTGSNNPILVVTALAGSNNYTVVGANASNCKSTVSVSLNVSDCTGLYESSRSAEGSVLLFPNPNSGDFQIITSGSGILSLENTLGQTVGELSLQAGKNSIRLGDELQNGLYLLHGNIEGQRVSKQILLIRN